MNVDVMATVELPLHDAVARRFWDGIADGCLLLPRCSGCGRWQWYPTETGPCCAGAELDWQQLAGTGSVFTYTTVYHAFLPSVATATPYTVGLIELDGADGIRFVGLLDLDIPVIGARVRMQVVEAGARRLPVFVAADA
jgi:uncharacterized OB-fold protein